MKKGEQKYREELHMPMTARDQWQDDAIKDIYARLRQLERLVWIGVGIAVAASIAIPLVKTHALGL